LNATDYRTLLQDAVSKDLRMEHTTVGIHRDDLDFTIRGFPVKKFASQGQQKSFLVALKFAQYDFIKKIKSMNPLLLLDDIYDKLDDERVTALMHLVSHGSFGQLFITDTHPDRLAKIFNKTGVDHKLFSVKEGLVTEVQHV
jgi:DNA replication and repair protein RecF